MADGIRVLYVDDEPGLLEIARLFLEETGEFTVTTAISAQEALASPSLLSQDAILSDYQMPGMDGIAFLKAVRQRSTDLPFLLFTGKGREEVVIDAINNGVDFYIQKGGDPRAQFAELAHKIKKAVERRSVKDALVNSEQRLNDIINFLPDATFAIDNHGTVIAWNRAIEEMTGVAAVDMLGRGSYEYALPFYGDRRPILIDLVSKPDAATEKRYSPLVRKEGDLLFAETTFAHPRNHDCSLSGIATPLRDKKGTIVGAIESIRDITGFQKVQEDLKQSEEQYRVLLGHSQDGAFLMQDGFLRFCNEAFARMIGSTQKEIIGTPVPDLIAPEDRDLVMERQRDRLIGKPLPESYEFNMLHRNATTRVPVMLSVGTGTYRNRPAVIGTVHDLTKEREHERALRESEENYRTLVETSFDGILIHQDGSLVYANKTTVRLFGAGSADELMGKPVLSFVHPDFRTVVHQRMTSATGEIQPVLHEKFLRADGSTFDADVVAIPFIWKDRPAVHVVFRDITGRRQSEDALKESEEKYRLVVENSRDAIYIHRADRLLFVNSRASELTGYPHDELMNLRLWDLVHPDDREGLMENAKKRFAGSEVTPGFTARLLTRDGSVRFCEFIADLVMYQGAPAILGIARDITGRRQVELALRESETKYRELVENANSIIVKLDKYGNVIFFNEFAQRFFGYTSDEIIGKPAVGTIVPATESESGRNLQVLLEEIVHNPETYFFNENENITRDGKRVWIRWQNKPFPDKNGQLDGVLCIGTDITERRQAEEALRKVLDDLEIRVQERTAELRESEERLKLKLDSILMPGTDISDLDLINILDMPAVQSLMDDFSRLTGMVTAIVDLKGNVIESSGWTDICKKFHRAHERSARFCTESDLYLARNLKPGQYVAYKCRNNLWDVVTPLFIGDKHVGNIYTGQFFYDDEIIDDAVFIAQAEEFGFDRENYMAAYHSVPRFSRERVDILMDYLVKFTGIISRLSYSNLQLARSMAEQNRVQEELRMLSGELEKRVIERTAELSKAQAAYQQANRKLNLLSVITRHDIKNQLLTLDGFVTLLHRKIPDPSYNEYFSRITNVSSQIANLIQFTKEYEEIGVHAPAWQDIRTLVDDAGKNVAFGQVVLKNDLPAGREIFADPLIAKVFFTLIDNALRHGGKLTTIRFSLDERDGHRVIVCADDGGGVSPDEKERIFDLGFGKNTGFGLSISREILDITGITITENGEPGEGARFEIAVPEGQFRSSP